MVSDKGGVKNRSRVPESEDRQVNEFANKHALEVIAEAAGDRDRAEAIMESGRASHDAGVALNKVNSTNPEAG